MDSELPTACCAGLTQTAEPPDDDSGQEAAVSYVPLILSYAALSVFTAVNPNEVQHHASLI